MPTDQRWKRLAADIRSRPEFEQWKDDPRVGRILKALDEGKPDEAIALAVGTMEEIVTEHALSHVSTEEWVRRGGPVADE